MQKGFYIGILFLFCGLFSNAQTPFFELYGNIETIAGTGQITKKSVNGWKKTFERKPADKAELSRPHFVMDDPSGHIYIADKDAHAIRKIDAKTNKITTLVGTGVAGDGKDDLPGNRTELHSPNGLYVLENGTVYILDLGNSKIRKIDKSGKCTTVIKDDAGIAFGRGLWVSETEDSIIYASGTELKIWTTKTPLRTYADGFRQLGNICVDAKGNLYAADRKAGKIFVLEAASGKAKHIAGNGLGEDDKKAGTDPKKISLEGVRAVWPTEDGGLLMGCHESHDIWYLSPKQKLYKFIDGGKDVHDRNNSPFDDGKKVSEVRSLCVAHNGDILICEHDGGFIRRVRKK